MNGHVDSGGRALIEVQARPESDSDPTEIQAWIDTGFTGELVLPQSLISQLGLPNSGTVEAILADGTQVALRTFSCGIRWFGEERNLEVVANEGDYPLLGVGLLRDRDLQINYRSGTVTID